MGNDLTTRIFFLLIIFWSILAIFTQLFDVTLTKTDITKSGELTNVKQSTADQVFSFLNKIPVVKNFTPLIQIMSFQYTNQVPAIMSIMLNALSIITLYVAYFTFKPNT